MLLIDGVRYELWTPPSEDALEQIVNEHAQDIFGKDTIYFDLKKGLITKAGVCSIPDGYVISLQKPPSWYICEVELHLHPLYAHIVPQITKFINSVKSFETQREIINSIDKEISDDPFKETLVKNRIGSSEVYRFIANLISKPPILAIVIDQKTQELEEVCSSLPIEVKVVEFQTFKRAGAETVHAHFFEALYKDIAPIINRQTTIKNEDIESNFIFIRVEKFWTKYKRLRIASEYLGGLLLSHDMSFELETDIGIIQTKIDKWNEICVGMGKWYKAHPELKVGDSVTFRVLEPSKRYRLEIEK